LRQDLKTEFELRAERRQQGIAGQDIAGLSLVEAFVPLSNCTSVGIQYVSRDGTGRLADVGDAALQAASGDLMIGWSR
jgi:hypothetical protein